MARTKSNCKKWIPAFAGMTLDSEIVNRFLGPDQWIRFRDSASGVPDQVRSKMAAMPWPPPMHMVASP